jgi:hypothetical protein
MTLAFSRFFIGNGPFRRALSCFELEVGPRDDDRRERDFILADQIPKLEVYMADGEFTDTVGMNWRRILDIILCYALFESHAKGSYSVIV